MQLSRRRFLQATGSLLGSSLMTSGYALGLEPMRLHIQSYHLTPKGWPWNLELKMVALADIHACHPYMSPERIAGIAETANGLCPDVIVLLGDYIASHKWVTRPVRPSEWAEALGALKAPLGVFAILGNHDWWADKAAQANGRGPTFTRLALEKAGIPVLENDAVRLKKQKAPFWIAGLADQLALLSGAGARRRGLDDLPGTLRKIEDDSPVIVLAHEPDIFPEVPNRVSLTLCGHTHGGQIRLLGYSPVVPSRFGNRYAYGHVTERDAEGGAQRHLIVSGGLGCSTLPIRFGVPPEIVVIALGASQPSQNP